MASVATGLTTASGVFKKRYDSKLRDLRSECSIIQELVKFDGSMAKTGESYNVGVAVGCRRPGLPYMLFIDADQIAEHDLMGRPITGLLRRPSIDETMITAPSFRSIISGTTMLISQWFETMLLSRILRN